MIIIILTTIVAIVASYILIEYGVQNEQYEILIRWFQCWSILLVIFIVILYKTDKPWYSPG